MSLQQTSQMSLDVLRASGHKRRGRRWCFKTGTAMLLALIMLVSLQTTVFASDPLVVDTSLRTTQNTNNDDATHIIIVHEEPEWPWLPISVTNETMNGFNAVRRVYALPPDVNPAVISQQSFDMLGQTFNFAHIVQEASEQQESQEVRETVRIETATSNLNEILPHLEQQLHFERDGFSGILSLDLSSVVSEVAGTTRTTSTATRRRTFPGLAEPDNAVIPLTISDGGITFHLASVNWIAGNSSQAVDGHAIPSTFTADATFTAQVTNTRITGYITTADYVGVVTRSMPGMIIYTAVFYGEPVIEIILSGPRHQSFPGLSEPNDDHIPDTIIESGNSYRLSNVEWIRSSSRSPDGQSMIYTYTANATFIPAGMVSQPDEATQIPVTPHPQTDGNQTQARAPMEPREPRESSGTGITVLIVILVLLAIAGAGVGAYFFAKDRFGGNVTVYSLHSPSEVVKAGKVKVNFQDDEPVITIDGPATKTPARTGRYIIAIAGKALALAAGKTVMVVKGALEARHEIPASVAQERQYDFTVDFSDEDMDDGSSGSGHEALL